MSVFSLSGLQNLCLKYPYDDVVVFESRDFVDTLDLVVVCEAIVGDRDVVCCSEIMVEVSVMVVILDELVDVFHVEWLNVEPVEYVEEP